jgi:hypothetical protein
MSKLVRDALKRAARKERRTVSSLLDEIILNYLEEQRYLLPHETGSDRRVHPRNVPKESFYLFPYFPVSYRKLN